MQVITADEFILGVLAELRLKGVQSFTLQDTANDARFEKAYKHLVANMSALSVEPDFSLMANPYHGDSGTLRETLYAVRERGHVAINNPRFTTVSITLSEEDAVHQLDRSTLSREFWSGLVKRYFLDQSGEPNGRFEYAAA